MPFPVLDWGVRAGTLPTLSRWVRSGSHHMAEWRPKLPATTPASQMGILHGTIDGIPAFRWVERDTGRVLVANKPADAAVIEAKHSDGRGLLVDDGVSVSNLFTGDAPTAYATMSAVHRTRGTTGHARYTVSTLPGAARGAGPQPVADGQRDRTRALPGRPRPASGRAPAGRRPWAFAFERAALSGVLRDLNTTLVADAMLQGHRVDLRRLRRLRRGRPPCRTHAARVARRPRGHRRGDRPARTGGGGGAARLPLRGALRPRPVPG